jgi:hypothetical protein
MRQRYARPLWVGVAVSVLLHALLFAGVNWTLPQWQDAAEPPAIEARLVPPPAPQAAVEPPPRPRPPAPRPKPVLLPPPPPEPAVAEAAPADAPVVAEAVPELQASVPVAPPEPEPAPDEPAPPPLNPLPQRIDMTFKLSLGPASGRQTLVWVNEGERYTVTSVTAATGFASLIYSGRFVQTSRGRITAQGLVPEEFWDQRGDKHASARFDQGQLTLTPSRGAPRQFAYRDGVQDALSLFFQFALTAPPPDGLIAYQVFNGKKLRDYAYEVRGEETLDTALGSLRTLHLARRTDSDGRFEVWLAVDRYYLPVRVLRVDDGVEGELAVASIASSE